MPSRKELLALSEKVDPAVEIINKYVDFMKFQSIRCGQGGYKTFGDCICRLNDEFRLVHDIMVALKIEFPDCKIELNAWWLTKKTYPEGRLERLPYNHPDIEHYEFIIDWE